MLTPGLASAVVVQSHLHSLEIIMGTALAQPVPKRDAAESESVKIPATPTSSVKTPLQFCLARPKLLALQLLPPQLAVSPHRPAFVADTCASGSSFSWVTLLWQHRVLRLERTALPQALGSPPHVPH